ncbi:MAG: IS21 family transposase [Eggerthellaceae bacterium]|nr:IS21 family transposase [Eggerthellaceae bacterium]
MFCGGGKGDGENGACGFQHDALREKMSEFPYRETVGLASIGFSPDRIAAIYGCDVDKTKEVVGNALALGAGELLSKRLTHDELRDLVDPPPTPDYFPVDCEVIFAEARPKKRSKAITEKHASRAWKVYLKRSQDSDLPPYSRKSFMEIYSEGYKKYFNGLIMAMNWTPGEAIQVDWAGKTIPIYGENGEETPAYIFVATLPYSNYAFARASLDMGMQSWLEHHRHMFEFFGGVPIFVKPDNARTAVIYKPGFRHVSARERQEINPQYQEFADHYGVVINLARSFSPDDKASVEIHVKLLVNRNLERLRSARFNSVDQLNLALEEILEEFNDRPTILRGISRKEHFLRFEAEHLAPLPEVPFTSVTWEKAKAREDATVLVRGAYYEIPERYAGKRVRIRITDDFVDVYTADRQRQMIAHHDRLPDASDTFEGFAGAHPDRRKPLAVWAAENNREGMLDQWHPTKNGKATPRTIVCRSVRKAWWQCPECGYEWQEAPLSRTSRNWDDCLACTDVDLVPGRNDLETLFPEIASEWHPDKNGLKPHEVFPSNQLKVWWIGAECGHEWRATIAERTGSAYGRLCPYCSGKRALGGFNDVATLLPELAKIWHPTKNPLRTPENTSVCHVGRVFLWDGSSEGTWLESPSKWAARNGYASVLEPFHSFVDEARKLDEEHRQVKSAENSIVDSKMAARGARYTRTRGISLKDWCEGNSREDLLEQWHPEKNGELTPKMVSFGSAMKCWWKCSEGHEWEASVVKRSNGNDCPYCSGNAVLAGFNDLATVRPDLAAEWHPVFNLPLKPPDVTSGSYKVIWWKCSEGHEWEASVRNRSKGHGCPYCAGQKVLAGYNDLATTHPDLAAEWHSDRNGTLLPNAITAGSNKKVWWHCEKGHEWQALVCHRANGRGCPYCAGQKVLAGFNDLATTRPDLAAEWHPTKNSGLRPEDVTSSSGKKVWWLCEMGHEWEAIVGQRSNDHGCPYCANKKVLAGFNDLATTHPDLAAEWHPTRNGDLRPDAVTAGSSRKVWWRCEKGHEWEAEVARRNRGAECPYCVNRKVLAGFNDLATTRPDLVADWHPTRNGDLRPDAVTAGSGKKVWWLCEMGHEWEDSVGHRSSGRGCPYCKNQGTVRKLQKPRRDLIRLNPTSSSTV